MKTLARCLLVAALGLIATGLLVGFVVPVHDDYGYDCGSAFRDAGNVGPLTDTLSGGSGATNCDAYRDAGKPLPLALILLGVTAGAVATTVAVSSREPSSTPDGT
jgi:hypothetical protein